MSEETIKKRLKARTFELANAITKLVGEYESETGLTVIRIDVLRRAAFTGSDEKLLNTVEPVIRL